MATKQQQNESGSDTPAGMKRVRVTAESLPYAEDGVNVVQLDQGQVLDMPAAVAVGLKAQGQVEDAEGAEITPLDPDERAARASSMASGRTPPQPGVVSGASGGGMAAPQELDDEQRKELGEARAAEAAATRVPAAGVRPDIEPTEHGGETIDRTLTRGADPKAVPVEDADSAAQAGKNIARAEIAQTEPEEEAEKAAQKRQEEKQAAQPDNKSSPRKK